MQFAIPFLLVLLRSCYGYQGPATRLTRYLLSQHDKCAPPDGVVTVEHEMELVHIVQVDELKQTMKVLVYIVEEWQDPTLSWEPSLFDGLDATWMPVETIWVPDIIVFNMLQHHSLLSSVRSPLKIYHTGRVLFAYPAIYTVMCKIGIADFPFDEQSCALRIASWGYGEEKLVLNATSKPTLQHYTANEEWALKSLGIQRSHYDHEGTVVSEARYVITVARKPLFYMVSLVLPSFIICLLSIAGLFARFSTKHEREERFTLGVTAILTMAVLSLVVAEKVPHSSEHVPLLVLFFHFEIVMVTVATLLTSTVMRVHTRGFTHDSLPPRWMERVVFLPAGRKRREEGQTYPRVYLAERWGAVSRRMDCAIGAFFLLVISLPTIVLFIQCEARLSAREDVLLLDSIDVPFHANHTRDDIF